MSEALERVYASAPAGELALHTVEISNPDFAAPYRFVQGYQDLEATLETAEVVTFTASGIGLSLPQRGVRGREDFLFQLDNITGDAMGAIRTAKDSGEVTQVIYRAFISTDLSGPELGPVVFLATSVKATIRSVQVAASFRDFVNKAWPRRRYTTTLTPGLRYIGA